MSQDAEDIPSQARQQAGRLIGELESRLAELNDDRADGRKALDDAISAARRVLAGLEKDSADASSQALANEDHS